MSRQEDIAALRAGRSVPADRVIELRSVGMDTIRAEFVLRLLRSSRSMDTLNIYWEHGLEFMLASRVEDAVRKLVFSRRHRVIGEFLDLWLLCYPDDDNAKRSVERELDRMVSAVATLVAARSEG